MKIIDECKDILEEALELIESGKYDVAKSKIQFIADMLEQLPYSSRKEIEPEWGIANSTVLMIEEQYIDAIDIIESSLSLCTDNYELYYSLGLCLERLNEIEKAYYTYKMAIFLGRGTSDEAIMVNELNTMCSYADANQYKLGVACQEVIEKRVGWGEYRKTNLFLAEQLFDKNREACNIVASEANMLWMIMLEIALCEESYFNGADYKLMNTIALYKNVSEFKKVYIPIKHLIRRIWFGLSIDEQKEINEFISRHMVSPDMLVVIAKYSVKPELWEDTFKRLCAVINNQFPQMADRLWRYVEWIDGRGTLYKEKCREPHECGSQLKIIKLDASKRFNSAITKDDAYKNHSKIAIIFCTNDEEYTKECELYLKRLIVPDGKKLEVIEVWNASGMASGYNYAMSVTDAEYKIYIHNDMFLIKDKLLDYVIQIFESDDKIGLIGLAGSVSLHQSGRWYKSSIEESRLNIYQDAIINIIEPYSCPDKGMVELADAVDGIFIATSKDIMWRDDIFDEWHFYDISQGYEFRNVGYKTVFVNDNEPWALHEITLKKDPYDRYDYYRKIFVETYLG